MNALLNRLRRQDGVALPIVMSALALTALLATTTLAVSVQGTQESARDRDGKRAAAAAHAAVEYGFLRTSELQPPAGMCVGAAVVAPQGGECPVFEVPADDAVRLGNGATMSFAVSLPGEASCPAAEPGEDDMRCITGIGEVNGIARRVRVAAQIAPLYQPWLGAGLVADRRVELENNGGWFTNVGTNGDMIAGNNVRITGQVQLGPAGVSDYGQNTTVTGGTVSVPRIDFPAVDYAPSLAENNNQALLNAGVLTNPTTDPRRFYMGNNAEFTFPTVPSGKQTYNVCSFTTTNNNKIRIPEGQVVKIYVDSPNRPGSGCAGASGKFEIVNSAEINLEVDANPAQLEVYVYGTGGTDTPDNPDVDFKNTATFYGTIYAPNSVVKMKNSAGFGGGIVGREIEFKNGSGFTWDTRVRDKALDGFGGASRRNWTECTAAPTVAGDPESGCS